VQLVKLAGARVIACASTPEKLKWLGELGADVRVQHRLEDFAQARFLAIEYEVMALLRGEVGQEHARLKVDRIRQID
jgi:NADPH-dependent curcumin reductase CurA